MSVLSLVSLVLRLVLPSVAPNLEHGRASNPRRKVTKDYAWNPERLWCGSSGMGYARIRCRTCTALDPVKSFPFTFQALGGHARHNGPSHNGLTRPAMTHDGKYSAHTLENTRLIGYHQKQPTRIRTLRTTLPLPRPWIQRGKCGGREPRSRLDLLGPWWPPSNRAPFA